MRHVLSLLPPAMLLLAVSGCGSLATAAGSGAAPKAVMIKGTDDFRFAPSTLTLKAGQPTQVTFENDGQILHDFTAQQGLGKAVLIPAEGQRSATAVVTYERAGTYKFFCSQPGHDELGMHGTITVTT